MLDDMTAEEMLDSIKMLNEIYADFMRKASQARQEVTFYEREANSAALAIRVMRRALKVNHHIVSEEA